ncbi:tRNA (adenosine(37)-N6)-threonylcarbamoyltransferase complex dimerization subunit type 1 TsaB [Thiotrichales bacterium 19S9-12]|nr:tRNA (adenosine(37)-N6)-threonylcarbamoyltransferase complex dimerization subunit type 1 TsaB [Thiotrichales bacterium 19S9-11]MCF6811356.1 tRNA (adenosine(37)-N6)-threonylcarbamoyltransferase complex dimerization subunit type 1 TsaB [Thiotrichales bacterium 19S9-12]
MKVLVIDTSTDSCSVSLLIDRDVYSKNIVQAKRHNELLLPTIDKLLSEHQVSLESLDYLACGIGPGSFVGVRLGISVIQGLSFAYDIPVVSFSSMAAIAAMVMKREKVSKIQVGIDAKMGDIYYGYYKLVSDVVEVIEEKSVLANELELVERARDLVGDGFKQKDIKKYMLHPAGPLTLRFIVPTIIYKINHEMLVKPTEALQPVYLQGTKNWKKINEK